MLGRGAGYLAQILLARILAPEYYGLYAIGWTILRLFSIAGHLGLDIGAIHFGSRYWQKDKSRFKSIILISLNSAFFSGVIAGFALYLAAPWLAVTFFKKPELEFILQGFAFAFPLATALRILAATSSISGKMLCGGVAEDVAQPFFQITLLIILINHGTETIWAAIISTLFSYLMAVAGGLICVRRLTPEVFSREKISLQDAKKLFYYSAPTILAVTLASFNLWGDRLIVGYFGTEKDTGIYQSISILTMLTATILSGIKITIAPIISKLYHNQQHNELKATAQNSTRWLLYLSTPILLLTILVPGEILKFLFGIEYTEGALPLVYLSIGQLFYIAFGISDILFLMTGNNKDWLIIATAIFIGTITLNAIAIPLAGLLGAALVSCSMMLLSGIFALFRIKQRLNFWLIDKTHAHVGIAGLITYTITALLISNSHFEAITKIALAGIISTITFVFLLLLIGLENSDKNLLINTFKQIQNKFKTR
jgi:O-antigen/teichoic acid export membrane protein